MAYLLLSTLFDAAQLRTLALLGTETAKLSVLSVAMLLKVVLLALESKSKARLLERPYRHLPPESLSGMLSRALFWWTVPLFHVGFQRLLSPVDIYPVDSSMQSDELEKRLSRILATSGTCSITPTLTASSMLIFRHVEAPCISTGLSQLLHKRYCTHGPISTDFGWLHILTDVPVGESN